MILFIRKHRFILAAFGFAAVPLVIIIGLFSIDNATNQMVVDYIESLGWRINPSPVEISHLTIPQSFDAVYSTYNAVQTGSGFDLTPFRGKKVSRYSYKVLNHRESAKSEVTASVLVYENRIIAGDISSSAMNGFMHALTETSNIAADN